MLVKPFLLRFRKIYFHFGFEYNPTFKIYTEVHVVIYLKPHANTTNTVREPSV